LSASLAPRRDVVPAASAAPPVSGKWLFQLELDARSARIADAPCCAWPCYRSYLARMDINRSELPLGLSGHGQQGLSPVSGSVFQFGELACQLVPL
jgi:hypothetical protein